jgi:hypothetical protein
MPYALLGFTLQSILLGQSACPSSEQAAPTSHFRSPGLSLCRPVRTYRTSIRMCDTHRRMARGLHSYARVRSHPVECYPTQAAVALMGLIGAF